MSEEDQDPAETDDLPSILSGFASQYDRKRGILTETDRKYLHGEYSPSGQEEWNLQYRLRQRIIHGVADFVLLQSLPTEELEKVSNELPYYDRDFMRDLGTQSTVLTYLLEFVVKYAHSSSQVDNVDDELADALEYALCSVRSDEAVPLSDLSDYVTVEIDINDIPEERKVQSIIKRIIEDSKSASGSPIRWLAYNADTDQLQEVIDRIEAKDDASRSQVKIKHYLQHAIDTRSFEL